MFSKLNWSPLGGHRSSTANPIYVSMLKASKDGKVTGSVETLLWVQTILRLCASSSMAFTGLLSYRLPLSDIKSWCCCSQCLEGGVFWKDTKGIYTYLHPVHTHMTHDSIAHQLEGFADCLYSFSTVTSIWVYCPVWEMVLIVHSIKDASNDAL